ncbi:YraN family protein [Kocuria massiliensis]|uniref:YraN family protein n=1 Tax=Kocuria massiliensis TaxID=1926282 RepID=UPI000A1CBFD3|nr:YraN family protein [Kocuria massiliensis]MCT1367381.1 YraN family protein [Rothia sp. p3-SID1597]
MNRCSNSRISLGLWGEEIASSLLCSLGWEVLERNWRPRPGCSTVRGEIDIIAVQGEQFVVCEVKTRSSLRFGHPFEAVDVSKAARLGRLAGAWCAATGTDRERVRVDVIAIVGDQRRFSVEHLVGVL